MIENQRRAAQTEDRMLQDRIIFLGKPIDDSVAQHLLAQLLFLLDRDSKEPISIYINSPGGSVPASFAIIDEMSEATAPVNTICVGVAAGTALLILAHGMKGGRFALPTARFQMTTLKVGGEPQVYDEAMRLELQRMDDLVVSQLAEDCGQLKERVRRDFKSELQLDAYQAKQYGLIDDIVRAQNSKLAAD